MLWCVDIIIPIQLLLLTSFPSVLNTQNIRDTYNCSLDDRVKHVKECMKREQIYTKKRETSASAGNELLTTRIAKKWNTTKGGQQNNKVRVLICEAFQSGYSCPEIALEIRKLAFRNGRYFDENRKSQDSTYESIAKQVRRLKNKFDKGDLNKLLGLTGKEKLKAMKKKSINPNARGRKPLNAASELEVKLGEWITKLEEEEKRITRTMIFRKALELEPGFCDGDIQKLKKWFYYGFKKRFDLSIRKIASVGQKLPKNWEEQMVDMRGRVRHRQGASQQPDGRVLITGVTDEYYFNTDHVPVWVESVGNYTWGRKSSGRRSVKTGGKEKDRYTVQLGVGKGGKKLDPFVVFKGERNLCFMFTMLKYLLYNILAHICSILFQARQRSTIQLNHSVINTEVRTVLLEKFMNANLIAMATITLLATKRTLQ